MDEAAKARIRAALKEAKLSMKAASLAAGRGETFVRDMLDRDRVPSVENLTALASVLSMTVAELIGEAAPTGTVPIVGLAGAGPEGTVAFSESDGELGEAPVPPGATDSTVAVEVRGTSMRGIADDGWLVYYDDRRDPPTEDLLGLPCVIELDDGRVLVKWLRRGSRKGRFTLESVSAPLMEDVKVKWAARVTFIMPQRGRRAA
jgi:lambda repressor-like predicted transcriptional regulator